MYPIFGNYFCFYNLIFEIIKKEIGIKRIASTNCFPFLNP